MTCPGLGMEVGASLGVNRSFYQGFFLAPMVTKGALKGAVFAANIYEKLGFPVIPNGQEPRQDIIQAVTLGEPERVVAFVGNPGCRTGGFLCGPGALGYAGL